MTQDDSLIETGKKLAETARILNKKLFPNRIPRNPEEIISMKERLQKEEETNREAQKARAEIKKILKARHDAFVERKKARRRKIKGALKRMVGKN